MKKLIALALIAALFTLPAEAGLLRSAMKHSPKPIEKTVSVTG